MKTTKASYRLFSYGLILMLIASFSLPTVAACAMAGQDCEKEMADCGGMVEDLSDQKSCPQQVHNSCDVCECTFKTDTRPGKFRWTEPGANKCICGYCCFVYSRRS